MVFIEYDHMIEQFAPTAADEPFRNAILPRASDASPFRLDAEALDGIDYVAVEIRGPIKDQILGSAIVGEGFAQPLRSPCASRVLRGIEMQNPTPVMDDDEETVQAPRVSVGTVKKSIAAITSRWLRRNTAFFTISAARVAT
jgi:hypothetical protein